MLLRRFGSFMVDWGGWLEVKRIWLNWIRIGEVRVGWTMVMVGGLGRRKAWIWWTLCTLWRAFWMRAEVERLAKDAGFWVKLLGILICLSSLEVIERCYWCYRDRSCCDDILDWSFYYMWNIHLKCMSLVF